MFFWGWQKFVILMSNLVPFPIIFFKKNRFFCGFILSFSLSPNKNILPFSSLLFQTFGSVHRCGLEFILHFFVKNVDNLILFITFLREENLFSHESFLSILTINIGMCPSFVL